ncbi:MAG: LPS export ABC transporter periplasmic protein LptC [Acidisphaera sp.]|nr:LPS export ABC transporter periplasmic protein LptC [Acidisphaera sp.]
MSVAPLPTARSRGERLLGVPGRVRRAPDARALARRRILVRLAKWVLPVVATALLTAIVMWPQIDHLAEAGRLALHRMTSGADGGQLTDARYRGVDERGRPYTLTATTAVQVSPERVDLVTPKGDVTLQNGAWLMLQSRQGVYIQHSGLLDLSGDVTLYRDDGVTVRTATAAVDLKQGAAAGNDTVSAEGPFGTLDAMGFATVDKGAVLQFTGPARLFLNSRRS